MASSQEPMALQLLRCYHCGKESTESSFKYFDNKKVDQPRYKCHHCQKFFTLGSHGRAQGKTYAKKRNEDPDELKTLSRQCRHCGVADNSRFKYYNNHNLAQPRFQCLSCKKHFQMRLLGTGKEKHLVHTSFQQRSAPHRRKTQGVCDEPFPSASIGFEEGSYQPFDGSYLPVASYPLMPCESGNVLWQDQMNGEDVQTFANFLETELSEPQESTYEENLNSWTGIGDSTEGLPPLTCEDAQYVDMLEAELLVPEENIDSAPNGDTCYFEPNVVTGPLQLPSASSTEDAELMGFSKVDAMDNTKEALLYNANMPVCDNMAGEMESEFAPNSNFGEVMYGTLAPSERSPAAAPYSEPEWASWTQNDAFCFKSNVVTDPLQLPSASSTEDAELMGFSKVNATDNTNEALQYNVNMPVLDNMAGEMESEFISNCNFGEVMYGTLAPSESRPAAAPYSELEWASWTQNDVNASEDSSFNWSYADAAVACCRQMDLDMAAAKKSMAQTAPCH